MPSSAGKTGTDTGSGGGPSGTNGGAEIGGAGLAGTSTEHEVAGRNAGGTASSGLESGSSGTSEPNAGRPFGRAGDASTATGAAGMGGVDAGTTGDAGSGNRDGQAGEQGCVQDNGTCNCDWLAPTCEGGKNLYTGQQCPPTFDEIRRVANWPLGGAPVSGMPKLTGEYEECEDGSRSFAFWQCKEFHGFAFDVDGQLLDWTLSGSCMLCEMRSDPPGEGMSCFPRGMSNGPVPSCMVDANGYWLMPPSCDE